MTHASQHDEEYLLPPVEALMAGTLALLMGYAQAGAECPNRRLMAKKIVSNLFFLAHHPQLSVPMQTMLGNLRTRWQLTLEQEVSVAASQAPQTPQSLWHNTPGLVQ